MKIVSACVGVVVALLFLVLVVSEPDQGAVAKSPLLGQPAPSVASTTIDGEPFALERRKGSWVVLNFFNSTCVPCINEHDLLVEFAANELANANAAELYTIINDDSSDAVRDFFVKNGGDWQKIKDDNGAIAVAFGVAKVPETWVMDPDGYVRVRILGALTEGFLTTRVDELKRQYAGQS